MLFRLVTILTLAGITPSFAADGTVSAAGSVEIAAPAKALRVRVELVGRGRDIKEALNKLQERREAAKRLFAAMDPLPGTLTFAAPSLGTEKSQRQQEMERLLGRAGRARAGKQPFPVIVVSAVRVDLPLKAATADDLLAVGHALQEKIKAADLGGVRDDEKRAAQEEEVPDEVGGREIPSSDEPKRGEPMFLYVAPVPESERDKALAEAFQRARNDAGRLARAAGAGLGSVVTLTEATQSGLEPEDSAGVPPPNFFQLAVVRRDMTDSENAKNEAVGMQPGRVVLRVYVNAQFALKPQ